ncbi:hypothetical protein V2J09_002382 [Rumex salicifolius]
MPNMGCLYYFLFNKLHHIYQNVHTLIIKHVSPAIATISQFLLTCVNPFWFHLSHFIIMPLIGFLALKMTNTAGNSASSSTRPDDLDIFFTSVSATTVSSMSVVEMEAFTTSQLVVMTVLMFVGGEVFVSMLSLVIRRKRFSSLDKLGDETGSLSMTHYGSDGNQMIQIELGYIHGSQVPRSTASLAKMKSRSIEILARIIFGYLTVIHFFGYSLVSLYISLTPSAGSTLQSKGLSLPLFSIFLTVSTFANCGFVPTNENMIAFRKNPGLLLILIPQILVGNTLFPCFLRLVIWMLEKVHKGEEYTYMLNNHNKLGITHLFSTFNTCMLAATALGLVALQFVLFCVMEWKNIGLEGLNSYEKIVGLFFQAVNSRHSGESVLDLSTVSTSIIVFFLVIMYLPSYTMFLPTCKKNQENGLIPENNNNNNNNRDETITTKMQRKSRVLDSMNIMLSPLFTLFIFTFLICITESKSLRDDPLNFNFLNIIVEIVSSYGNVGYSMGYSCEKRLNVDGSCKDMSYGFSGRWSKEGKALLIVLMLYGRLKKFYLQGGQGWHLM